ncbi:MAG: 50S ribosomal protein L25, partial [Cyanobacteria bacterium P01_A01_bin.135]
MELSLKCETRSPGSKPRALRREGRIPASLYGHDGNSS